MEKGVISGESIPALLNCDPRWGEGQFLNTYSKLSLLSVLAMKSRRIEFLPWWQRVANTAQKEMPLTPAPQNSWSVRKEPYSRYAALHAQNVQVFWRRPDSIALDTQGPWQLTQFLYLSPPPKNGVTTPTFKKFHRNVVRLQWHHASETALKIADFYRNPRYHYK